MDIRKSIHQILSDKKVRYTGLHINHIARHILNMNTSLFPDEELPEFDVLKIRINRIMLYDIHQSKSPRFTRVFNPKTNTYRKGVYKLKR
ncbi:MAG TPA: hypothetical protein VFD91_04910 [Mariniphaga sp.]|nr:hypothetical protein [Mariniphaga sp.]